MWDESAFHERGSEIDNRVLVVTFVCVGLNGSVELNFLFNNKQEILQVFPFGFEEFAINKRAGQNIDIIKLSRRNKNSQN